MLEIQKDLESEVVEVLWVEIKVRKTNIMCTIYRPPNTGCLVVEGVGRIKSCGQEGKEVEEPNCNMLSHSNRCTMEACEEECHLLPTTHNL